MPSRKRNKGKARKAKAGGQQGQERHCSPQQEPTLHQLNDLLLQLTKKCSLVQNMLGECNHGAPPATHIGRFMHEFEPALVGAFGGGAPHPIDLFEALSDSLDDLGLNTTYINDDNREQILQYLVALGTNYVLRGSGAISKMAIITAMFVIRVEMGCRSLKFDDPYVHCTTRDLASDEIRGAAKFFAKRATCACLKDTMKQVKSDPKVGYCYYCNKKKERKELKICGRCRMNHYCSIECQRLHWPAHKHVCNKSQR